MVEWQRRTQNMLLAGARSIAQVRLETRRAKGSSRCRLRRRREHRRRISRLPTRSCVGQQQSPPMSKTTTTMHPGTGKVTWLSTLTRCHPEMFGEQVDQRPLKKRTKTGLASMKGKGKYAVRARLMKNFFKVLPLDIIFEVGPLCP